MKTEDLEDFCMDAHTVALIGGGNLPVKTVHNWTERGLIRYEARKINMRSKRVYSLASCLEVCALTHIARNETSLSAAHKMGKVILDRARELLSKDIDVDREENWQIFFYGFEKHDHETKLIGRFVSREHRLSELDELRFGLPPSLGIERRLFPVDEAIAHVFRRWREKKDAKDVSSEIEQ